MKYLNTNSQNWYQNYQNEYISEDKIDLESLFLENIFRLNIGSSKYFH